MDITSPITLWKDYDVSALPLNESSLSPKTENGATVKEYYFDGYTTVDGRVRTFVKITEAPTCKGIVLYLSDYNDEQDKTLIDTLIGFGYTVAAMDYKGSSENGRHTLYPASLSDCTVGDSRMFSVPESGSNNWYIWTCLARRTVSLLKTLYPNTNIYALGMGLGGTTVYKLACFDDGLTACATLLNIIPTVEGSGNSLINYHASLDNSAYATISKIPMFMAVASNDVDGSLDDMSELAENTESLKCFRIVERGFSHGIKSVYNELNNFLTEISENKDVIPRPEITASNSEGSLYFNIEVPENENVQVQTRLDLFVSFAIEDAPFRNWMSLPVLSLGGGKYMCKINVCNENKPLHAFANLIAENGDVQSSDLITIIPKNLGIKERPGVSHRKIYDGSMGKDGWTTRDGGEINVAKGPYDIEGVTTTSKSLVSFKLGDPLFKVDADTMLQAMICGKPQEITVSVADKTNTYSYRTEIKSEEDWSKLSLTHMNFKGPAGTLLDWSQVCILEFSSDEQFILGSVLWI